MSRLAGLGLAALLGLAACKREPDTRTPAERGKAAYASYNCRQCHRVGPEGGTIGPDLTFVGFRKSAAFLDLWLKDPRGWQVSTKMPTFGFTDRVRQDVVAYLATLQGQDYAAAKPWNAAAGPLNRGKELYARLGCGSCHGNSGEGGMKNNNVPGGKIPALRETVSTYSNAELERKIRHGVPRPDKEDPAGPEPMVTMPAWGRKLTDDELGALVDYLRTFKPSKAEDW